MSNYLQEEAVKDLIRQELKDCAEFMLEDALQNQLKTVRITSMINFLNERLKNSGV